MRMIVPNATGPDSIVSAERESLWAVQPLIAALVMLVSWAFFVGKHERDSSRETDPPLHGGWDIAGWIRRQRAVVPILPSPVVDVEKPAVKTPRPSDAISTEDLEQLAEFHISAGREAAFAAMWDGADFIGEVLDKEEPMVGDWVDEVRRVDCRHPLAVPVPRWCGLSGLSIPTVKLQRREAPRVVLERSSFAGFPLADAFVVETAWVFDAETDGTTSVKVKFRLDFESYVPGWLRPLVVSKTRAELVIFNDGLARVARRHADGNPLQEEDQLLGGSDADASVPFVRRPCTGFLTAVCFDDAALRDLPPDGPDVFLEELPRHGAPNALAGVCFDDPRVRLECTIA